MLPATETTEDYLIALGDRIKTLRAMRGMTRKDLAQASDVSERYLANLETGTGNASILLLKRIAEALAMPITELFSPDDGANGELTLIRQLLTQLDDSELAEARKLITKRFNYRDTGAHQTRPVALIGLRGAGKSTLCKRLAKHLDWACIELNDLIEKQAGMGIGQIHALFDQATYRRYEYNALVSSLKIREDFVLATPGSLVSEPSTFAFLLANFFTIWLKASPEEHMARVIAQGDMRPMAGNTKAMDDLKRILSGREKLYAKADITVDTSDHSEEETFAELCKKLGPQGVPSTSLSG